MLLDGASCAEDCARQEGRVRLTGNQHGVPCAYLAVRLVVVGATMRAEHADKSLAQWLEIEDREHHRGIWFAHILGTH